MFIANIIYICYRKCRGLFKKKHDINYMLKYFKCDNSNEGQDSKMPYWLFLAPQTFYIIFFYFFTFLMTYQ